MLPTSDSPSFTATIVTPQIGESKLSLPFFVVLLVRILFSGANLPGRYFAKLLQGRTLMAQDGRVDLAAAHNSTFLFALASPWGKKG
jgi:hypothetical protein